MDCNDISENKIKQISEDIILEKGVPFEVATDKQKYRIEILEFNDKGIFKFEIVTLRKGIIFNK